MSVLFIHILFMVHIILHANWPVFCQAFHFHLTIAKVIVSKYKNLPERSASKWHIIFWPVIVRNGVIQNTNVSINYGTPCIHYSLFFLTWPLDFAPAQCYHHQFRDNSAARLGKTNCRLDRGPWKVRHVKRESSYNATSLGCTCWPVKAWYFVRFSCCSWLSLQG